MADPIYRDLCDWTRKAVDNYTISEVSDMYINGSPLEDCGDTLFTFIVRELEEADNKGNADEMLDNASNQLLALKDSL